MIPPEETTQKSEMESRFRFCRKLLREKALTEKVLRYENKGLREHTEFLERELQALRDEVKLLQEDAKKRLPPPFWKKMQEYKALLREKLFPDTFKGAYKKWKFYSSCSREYLFSDTFGKFLLLRQNAEKLSSESDSALPHLSALPLTSLVLTGAGDPWEMISFLELFFAKAAKVPFELLIVSQGKKRELSTLVSLYPGVKIIDSCDKKPILEGARGEYLLFTDVKNLLLPGTLEELASTLYNTPSAGGAVPRFYDAFTAELLESGLRLCRNGDVIPYGGTEESSLSRSDHLRECDSFLRFSFVIRRKHLEELPAVPGSSDMDPLTFGATLTQKGVSLYLAPCARVLCTASAPKVNEASVEWKERFCTLLEAGKHPSREEFFKAPSGKKNILYIDAEIPRADRGSGGMDALFFMEYMIKRGYHVLFFGENTPCYVPKYTSILQRMGVECFTAGKKQFKEYLRSRGHLFDFVFVSRVYQAQNFDRLIRKYLPQAACIFNTVDLHFLREQREAALKKSQELTLHAFMTEKAELNLMSRADAVILISSEEKRFLASVFGMENCHHIPQARKIYGRTAPPDRRSGLLFIGSAHNPNADALKYYVEEILPLLKKRNLPCHLTVIGEELRKDIRQQKELAHVADCPHIRWAGFAEDPREFFEEAKVAIAPLRYGAGTKGKVATAMAYGVPCVTTSCGAEGTNMKDGEHILVRDSASDFARAIEELMNDNALWMKISEGGFAFLKENYAFETIEKQMDEVLSAAQEHHKLQRAIWQELRPGEGLFPRATPTLPPRLFEALRTIQHDRYGSVFCETEQEKIACGEIVSPHFKTGKNIFEEEERYSYILLSSPFNGTSRETESISCALELLYDGGRLIMPCPGAQVPEETLKKLFFEEPLLLSIAYSPIFNVLCLTKILPERSEIVSEE